MKKLIFLLYLNFFSLISTFNQGLNFQILKNSKNVKFSSFSFFLLFLLCFSSETKAQDLTTDLKFFKAQEQLYQQWLDHSGLGQVFSVYTVEVEPETLALYLKFPFSNTDSVTNAWRQIKKDFEKSSTISLEKQLFYKMTHIMQIEESEGNVQLYDTYDVLIEPCFFRGIFFEDEEVKVDSSACRADLKPMEFNPKDFPLSIQSISFDDRVEKLQKLYDSEKVFNIIYEYALQRYKIQYSNDDCLGRKPKVKKLERTKNTLRFSVTDLCQEVTAEENHWFCDWVIKRFFKRDCNWTIREKLIFRFDYEDTETGFKLSGSINGLVGSGYYDEVRRGGYANMEEDPRFQTLLEDYVREINEIIENLIRQP